MPKPCRSPIKVATHFVRYYVCCRCTRKTTSKSMLSFAKEGTNKKEEEKTEIPCLTDPVESSASVKKMKKPRKRKNPELQRQQNQPHSLANKKSSTKRALPISSPNEVSKDPYPTHQWPTPEQCQAVRDNLLALHGFPQEFAKYRRQNPINADDFNGGSESKDSVLDGLVMTVLSQNTTEVNSQRAFASLKSAFPTWEDVLNADSKCIEDAIRCGGLAPTKASCIKNTLKSLLERKGKLCLEYLRDFSVDEVKAELSRFKGIGPKTVACVLMFHLRQDDFPLDTHVFEIAKALGWLPAVADRNKAYLHLNQRIPNELKFDLNCLLYTHGKMCRKCIKKEGVNQIRKGDDSCPLLHYRKDFESL